MKISHHRLLSLIASGLLVAPAFAAPTTNPSNSTDTPTTKPAEVTKTGEKRAKPRQADPELQAAVQDFLTQFRPVATKLIPLMQPREDWSDAAKRTAKAEKLQDDLKSALTIIDETALKGKPTVVESTGATPFVTLAAVFGDADVQKQLDEMSKKDGVEGRWAKVATAESKYWFAGKDAAAQGKALDGLEALVKSDPATKISVAQSEAGFYSAKPSKEVAERIDTYVTDTLKSKAITQIKMQQKVEALAEQFKAAGKNDTAAQGKVLDSMEELVNSEPDSKMYVAQAEAEMYRSEPSKEISDRIDTYVTKTLKVPGMIENLKMMMASEAKQKSLVGKPMVIAGPLRDSGTTFSTADLKGKVVLIDFWATWCGPCKAELPRVTKAYADFHSQGLEIVSVSLDQNVGALDKFLADRPDMPWPQIFDPKHTFWNCQIAKDNGIMAIPTMFLIDKNGICHSVTAREDFEKVIPELLAEKAPM